MSIELSVDESGTIRCIYHDALAELIQEGSGTLQRASHVEPDPERLGFWVADLSPVGGPVLNGFKLRQQALDAEVEWLSSNYL